jgi:hypothetical protein
MSISWQQHPILKPPTDEELAGMAAEDVVALWNTYHEAIRNSVLDPYRYGWKLPNWEYADKMLEKHRTLLLLGANRSSKTSYGARTCVRAALENPDSLIFCFSQNQETSVLVQQSAIYNYLPAELKKKATEETHYMSYSMQNGFAGNSVVLPNRSRIIFKTYTQFQQNQTILEGMELGSPCPKWLNVGAWMDEYLLGMEMLDRLYLRLATRNARVMLTFTPKDGETETVRYYKDGAVTLERREAPLMESLHGKRGYKVPYVQESDKKDTGIIYFHSIDNPWGGYDAIVDQCRAKNDPNYTLTAAYGVPTKTYSTKFPQFSVGLNVVEPDAIPKSNVTRYMVLDPAGRKNWFMCWIAVDATDTWWVYREWPDVTSVGDWASQKGGKWVPGDGAKGLGYGIRDYVSLITNIEAEHKETIFERLIDPRLGAAKYSGNTGASSIIEDLSDAGLTFIPAPGLDIEDGLQALQTKLSYSSKQLVDGINRPHFYVSSKCQNIIMALQEYTADGGIEEAWKDPIDVLRYAAIDGIRYIDPKAFINRRTAKGY